MNDNGLMVAQKVGEEQGSSFDIFMQMKTGVALGTRHKNVEVIELRTFITNAMLKGEQVTLSISLDEKYHIGAIRKKQAEEE